MNEVYKKTDLKIGDKVKLNQKYFTDGLSCFGKELRYPRDKNHYFIITNILYGNGEIDGHGDIVKDVIVVDGGKYQEITSVCECFLELFN
jgi:hypothetical protein